MVLKRTAHLLESLPPFPRRGICSAASKICETVRPACIAARPALTAYRTASGPCGRPRARARPGADLGKVASSGTSCTHFTMEVQSRWPLHAGPPPCPSAGVCPAAVLSTVERHGYLFFFNGPQPLFPLPFEDSVGAGFQPVAPTQAGWKPAPRIRDDYVAARPLRFSPTCPWTGERQQLRCSTSARHGRDLLGEPVIDCPHPLPRRIRVIFRVRETRSSIVFAAGSWASRLRCR